MSSEADPGMVRDLRLVPGFGGAPKKDVCTVCGHPGKLTCLRYVCDQPPPMHAACATEVVPDRMRRRLRIIPDPQP